MYKIDPDLILQVYDKCALGKYGSGQLLEADGGGRMSSEVRPWTRVTRAVLAEVLSLIHEDQLDPFSSKLAASRLIHPLFEK